MQEAPVLKMQGTATVNTEDATEDVLRRSLLKFYSLHITDFPTEETLSLVGDSMDELIDAVKETWPDYSVEFCIGTIWRNDTGAVVGQLVEDPEDPLSQGWVLTDGEERFVAVLS